MWYNANIRPMIIRLSVTKDGKTLARADYDIADSVDFEKACIEIWRKARMAQPTERPEVGAFLSGLDDLYGAVMKLDKPD